MQHLPLTVPQLIELLDKEYPLRPPDIRDEDRKVWYKVGQRSVVDALLQLQKDDEENNIMNLQEE